MKTKFINNKIRLIFNEFPEHLFCKQVLGDNENKAVFGRIDQIEEKDENGNIVIHPVIDLYRFKKQGNKMDSDDPKRYSPRTTKID